MFDFAWSELGLIAFVSVLVLGPKQLPETMRTLAKVLRRVRSLSAEFQGHFNDMVREAELEELRQQVQKLSQASVSTEVTKLVDPDGSLQASLTGTPAPTAAESAATEGAETAHPEHPAIENAASSDGPGPENVAPHEPMTQSDVVHADPHGEEPHAAHEPPSPPPSAAPGPAGSGT